MAGGKMSDHSSSFQFRPRARIIRTIGDQLISGPEAAVIELVKNAYDADASRVDIVFRGPLDPGEGGITVSDDGHGMTLADIQEKWMEPATSSKIGMRRSRSKNRAVMGSKGIGRFAAAKLGHRMMLRSISDDHDGRYEILVGEVDWSAFSGDRYLSDVEIDFSSQTTDSPPGTEIEISGLAEGWSKEKLSRLVLELRRLVSPISGANQETYPFRIYLDLTGLTQETAGFDGAALVNTARSGEADFGGAEPNQITPFPLLRNCDYEVSGVFDPQGRFNGTLEIRRGNLPPVPLSLSFPREPDEDSCGTVSVQFYIFDREAEGLKRNMAEAGLGNLSAGEARSILDNVAGIAVYRSGFRVRPYGDLEHDWLTLDRRRVQDPTLRIGHNQIAGYVTVEAEGGQLVEKSSREGFEDNGAYRRLQRLIRGMLAEAIEPRRKIYREKAGLSRRNASGFNEVKQLATLQRLKSLVPKLPEQDRESAEQLITDEAVRLSGRIEVLEERQRQLEAKSSLGNIIREILHEGRPRAMYLAENGERVQRLWQVYLNNDERREKARQDISRKLELMRQRGEELGNLFDLLQPLAGGRRGAPRFFSPLSVVESARDIFASDGVKISLKNGIGTPEVLGFPDDLSTAMVNLLGNSVHWLTQGAIPDAHIEVIFSHTPTEVIILVQDNGPGISDDVAESIFDAGFTLKDEGTGLGLNIAREALSRSSATLDLDREYEGGAGFIITLDRGKSR